MLVRDVMTAPATTVQPKTTISRALQLLDVHSVTMLPVVSEAGAIVGVLSEADVVLDALPADVRTHLIPSGELDEVGRAHEVGDLMNPRPVTVGPDTDLATAATLMTDSVVKSLPVVDEGGQVVGVLSRRDIVHVLARSDLAIEAEVDDLFRRLGTDWMVDVVDGRVTVSGPSGEAERSMAESVALSVPGVRRVVVAE
jgi:CBS domain-containing protein